MPSWGHTPLLLEKLRASTHYDLTLTFNYYHEYIQGYELTVDGTSTSDSSEVFVQTSHQLSLSLRAEVDRKCL